MNEKEPKGTPGEATRLIRKQQEGDREAADRLLQLLYTELRVIARSYFAAKPRNQTLQPTALVHEAFMRLVGNSEIHWEGRSHFLAVAARAMRNILANHIRDRNRAKRGGGWERVTLSEIDGNDKNTAFDALDLHEALEELANFNERQVKIVELRFFGGLTVEEAASVLGISERTVRNEWRLARAWLRQKLGKGEQA